jgi:hypothetical protein
MRPNLRVRLWNNASLIFLAAGLFVAGRAEATTTQPIQVTCPVCATKIDASVILSTNTFGGQDADLLSRARGAQPLLIQPIVCTASHLFWSEDRRSFIPAGKLREGETLRTAAGTAARLVKSTARTVPVPVYNLEIEFEHIYYVTGDGVLVHNMCAEAADDETAPNGFRKGGMFGATERQVLKSAPKSWKKVRARGNGWKLLDGNNIERIRFMRPDPQGKYFHEKTGYWRLQNAAGDYLDEFGNVVPITDPNFSIKTHIPYSGSR